MSHKLLHIFIVFTSLTLTYIDWPLLAGENASACYGSVLQGQFEGTIHTANGTYHVESVQRYTSRETDHHSIIYREDDMGKTILPFPLLGNVCRKCLLARYFQACTGSVGTSESNNWLVAFTGQFELMARVQKEISCHGWSPTTLDFLLEISQRDGLINLSSVLILEALLKKYISISGARSH